MAAHPSVDHYGRAQRMLERWALIQQIGVRRPRLLADYLGAYLRSRRAPWAWLRRNQMAGSLAPDEARERIAAIVGAWADGPALACVRAWTFPPQEADGVAMCQAADFAADRSLGELLYQLVRGLRPALVVETGVAGGMSSAYILAGLADNEAGQLRSIDLPPAGLVVGGLIAAAVPPGLRDRWAYHWGASRRLLPELLAGNGGIVNLFVHDSDHSYSNMRWELEQAWEALSAGGWLVADDIDLHDAFRDVAAGRGEPLLVTQPATQRCAGFLCKPTRVPRPNRRDG